jgi:hypothetical protein
MTGLAGQMVNPRSTWVLTHENSLTHPERPLVNSSYTCGSTHGQGVGQTPLPSQCPQVPAGTFATFSKIHLNT